MKYDEFIAGKVRGFESSGFKYSRKSGALFPFQSKIVERSIDAGRFCVFADCGLGKTLMQLEWAANVPGRTVILAPLGVVAQTINEAERFGMGDVIDSGQVVVTNYEKLHRIDPDDFDAVVLDESSILKNYSGKIRTQIIESFAAHRFKLACTATPSPNDIMELGNHAEFVGAMTRFEMLAMFFVHDGGDTSKWRVKGHAKREFWRWVSRWASMVRKPSDLGCDDTGFELPEMRVHHYTVAGAASSALIPGVAPMDLHERRRMRRESIAERVDCAASLDDGNSKFLMWCDLNDESKAMTAAVDDAVEVAGATDPDMKADRLVGFGNGSIRALVTKPKIGGFGMNWQKCHRMAFVGLSDSYEAFYQSTRRCWRFGQTEPVDVYLIYSDAERAVVENVMAKERTHEEMQDAMVAILKEAS